MKIYIAGPMQGYPDFNFPAFDRVASALKQQGHVVFNPADKDREKHGSAFGQGTDGQLDQVPEFNLRKALEDDLCWICRHADVVFMLKGWERSFGARTEHALAVALKLEIWYE